MILKEKKFIYTSNININSYLNRILNYQNNKPSKYDYLRITITNNCNLKCNYCFMNAVTDNKLSITKQTLVQKIEEFAKKSSGYPTIHYFGGEPLLRDDLINLGHDTLTDCVDKGFIKGFKEEIVTNGTLLNDNNLNKLKSKNIDVVVSIDGWKEINDKNRVYTNGTGSYNDVIKGIDLLRTNGLVVKIIITPSKDNVNIIYDIIKYFVEIINVDDITINTPQPVEEGWDIDGKIFAEQLIMTYTYLLDKQIEFKSLLNNLLYLIKNGLPQLHSCMNSIYAAKINSFGIFCSIEGELYKCVVDFNKYSMKENNDFETTSSIEWYKKNDRADKCKKCDILLFCGGSCSMEHYNCNNKWNKEKCKFNHYVFNWVVKNI